LKKDYAVTCQRMEKASARLCLLNGPTFRTFLPLTVAEMDSWT